MEKNKLKQLIIEHKERFLSSENLVNRESQVTLPEQVRP